MAGADSWYRHADVGPISGAVQMPEISAIRASHATGDRATRIWSDAANPVRVVWGT